MFLREEGRIQVLVGIAPSTKTVGSLLKTPDRHWWLEKQSECSKFLKTYFIESLLCWAIFLALNTPKVLSLNPPNPVDESACRCQSGFGQNKHSKEILERGIITEMH
jgi:hypothetical protein